MGARLNEEGDHLFYIASGEESDLSQNSGFIDFYADAVIEQDFADRVFEAEVKDKDDEGIEFVLR